MSQERIHTNNTYDVAQLEGVDMNVRSLTATDEHYISFSAHKYLSDGDDYLSVYSKQDIHLTTEQLEQLFGTINNYLSDLEKKKQYQMWLAEATALAQYDAQRDDEGISLA